jgi:anaphase-promoting complex subunit 10
MDESYTPEKISLRCGTAYYDLQEVRQFTFPEKPQGWVAVPVAEDGYFPFPASFLLSSFKL